jgi:hypothetical protein
LQKKCFAQLFYNYVLALAKGLRKEALLYKKRTRKMLMNLNTGGNHTKLCFFKFSDFCCFKKKYFFGVPHLSTCIFILFNYCMNQDWVQELILAWH